MIDYLTRFLYGSNESKTPRDFHLREFFCIQRELVDHNYITSLRTLGACLNGEFNLLAFLEVFETITLDRGEMHENIRAAIASKKAIALAAVEPFDCSDNTF